MAEKEGGLPKDSKGWLEFATKIDPRDHKKAAAGLGLAIATGLGVGVYALSKKHGSKTVKVAFGDRHLEKEGVVSMLEAGRDGKFAVGLPQDEGNHPEEFSMDAEVDGTLAIVRPNGQHSELHESRLQKAREWLVDLLTQRATSEE
jgi:hypothetical protein